MSKARGLADLGNVYSDGALSNRNILINGNFTVNQRGLSIASVSIGSYGEDRWKKTSGGMTQIVEEVNYLPSTVYTLSGTGVTTQQITSPSSGNWTLPDIPVTARLIQLELGDTATLFEHRSHGQELALCQRYLRRVYVRTFTGVIYTINGDLRMNPISYGAMRSTPSVSPATFTNHSINFSEDGAGVNTPSIVWSVLAFGDADREGSLSFGYSSGTLSSFGGSGSVATLGGGVYTTFTLDAEL